MTWLYNDQELNDLPEAYYGFVYLITNTKTGKKYFGKKLFYSQKQKQVKGKKKKYKVESDWKFYYGSNEELTNDVNQHGVEAFTRVILKLCKTKGECSYFEAKYQLENDVLLYPELYYNSWVQCKIHRKHLKLSDAG